MEIDFLTWVFYSTFSTIVLAMGWLHSVVAIVVFVHNRILITRKMFTLACIPFGILVYAWYLVGVELWLWVYGKEETETHTIDWSRIL